MPTYVAKPAEAQATRKWYVVDATNQPLGRLASRIAAVLRGKHKPTYTPHVDTGDFVIVINASKVKLSGTKTTNKMYYRHSGYPGAIRGESFEHVVQRHPDAPLTLAVKGMLPKNVLGRQMLEKLKVYGTGDHPHRAQQPESLNV
ncbi:MAG: 50S ribosomal protein L13 [Polyangiaceae bacterium]